MPCYLRVYLYTFLVHLHFLTLFQYLKKNPTFNTSSPRAPFPTPPLQRNDRHPAAQAEAVQAQTTTADRSERAAHTVLCPAFFT